MNGLISWFTRNSVAANLLMVMILLTGAYSLAAKIPIEAHPHFESDSVQVDVEHRGATPREVEESVIVRIEEAIQDLEGIKSIRSTAQEGIGQVEVEVADGYNQRELQEDIKNRVDAITTFPDEIERPLISSSHWQRDAISVVVAGDLSERQLRRLGERVRDDIAALPGVSKVELTSVRPYEVSIEVSEKTLQRYGLTFSAIADAINKSSLDLPAGAIRTSAGEVLLRTKGQAYVKEDFESVVVLTRSDGTRLTLGDIANVVDGFEEDPVFATFNGKRCVMIEIYRVGNQSIMQISKTVTDYVEEVRETLPPGVEIADWRDGSKHIRLRISTLVNSALQGMLLIFVVLTLFLRISVAIWVCVGIPISVVGAFALMPVLGVSINYTSVFAFIMVVGLVVDDAIVTGENVYRRLRHQQDEDSTVAAIRGTQEVAVPVTFGMLTTVVAFYAMTFLSGGATSRIFVIIPLIVIPVLMFSLIESKFILPAHLKHVRIKPDGETNPLLRIQRYIADGLEYCIDRFYAPVLAAALRQRYFTLSLFIGTAVVLVSLVVSGWIGFTFFPHVQSDVARSALTMPVGTPFDTTRRYVNRMTSAAERLRGEYIDPVSGESIITDIYATVGSSRETKRAQPHLGLVMFEMVPPELHALETSSMEIVQRWRRLIGPIPGAEQLSFVGHIRHGGLPIEIELISDDLDALARFAEEIKTYLSGYAGVFDISDDFEIGKEEIQLSIKPEAELLGLSMEDLARQVRQAFFGEEAQRIQRGRDDVRIMVRYPKDDRQSLSNLETMRIRTPEGVEVPFNDVADAKLGRGFSTIRRTDRYRTLTVSADINKKTVDLEALRRDLAAFLKTTASAFPEVRTRYQGEAREQADSFSGVQFGAVIVLVAIYAMLAIPFRSYVQPLIVMTAIPFGILGAILGHLMLGMNLTINSVIGMLALSGVVVNDSLVLVDFINRRRRDGMTIGDAVRSAGAARFRAIMLTSLTTFAGLLPLMFEENTQAQFLIPMAVSLGFGILFATFITLLLVPINYLILEDIRKIATSRKLKRTSIDLSS